MAEPRAGGRGGAVTRADATSTAPAWRGALAAATDAAVLALADHDARVPASALRAGAAALCAAIERAAAGEPVGHVPLAPALPVAALVRAVRRALLAQPAAGALDAADAVALCAALEQVDAAIGGDAGHRFAAMLGDGALPLLVDVAHDMRSPLGSILFLVDQLRGGGSGPVTPVQARQLAIVHGAALGLSGLASDLMDLARGGATLLGGAPAALELPALLARVEALLAPVAAERGLALVVGTSIAEPRAGHGAALQRVLLNLATNALKFTETGSVHVEAEAIGATRVRFAVRDTGRGIPDDVLGSLFDTFRRRVGPGDYVFSSAGLGLSICQTLVQAMGGELAVETALGAGTTFRFELELPPVAAGA